MGNIIVILYAIQIFINCSAFTLTVISGNLFDYILSLGLGYLFLFAIILVYHRHLTHRAYEIKYFRFPLVFLASMALQGPPRKWVITHKIHHKECDTKDDPHTPLNSIFHAFSSGIFDKRSHNIRFKYSRMIVDTFKYTEGIEYDILDTYYFEIIISMSILLYSTFGIDCIIVWYSGAFITLVQAGLVNAFCHKTSIQTIGGCHAINNIMLWPFLLGANWHKNHHDNPRRINLQKNWYEIDLHYAVYKVFERIGICTKKRA